MYLTAKQARANSEARAQAHADRLATELNSGVGVASPVVIDYLDRIHVKIEASLGNSVDWHVGELGNPQLQALSNVLTGLGYTVEYSCSSHPANERIFISW
jgi:hypothetical protein